MKANRKIMNTKQEVTDEEIRSFMNFDQLLSESRAIELRRRNISRLIWSGVAIVLVSGLTTTVYLSQDNTKKATLPKEQSAINIIDPIEPKEEENKNSGAKETHEMKPASKDETKSSVQQKKDLENKNKATSDQESAVNTSIYKEAEPVAGFPHLYEYFNTELTYPKEAVKDSVRGVVTVSFVINKEGKPEQVTIVHSLGALFDQEVYRLIEQMPAWKPATMNNRPTLAKISLPLTFRLEKSK